MSSSPALFDRAILGQANRDAFRKLDPRGLCRNPVIFVTEAVAVLVSLPWSLNPDAFAGRIALWLWLTVLFSTFAEAITEGRGKPPACAPAIWCASRRAS